MKALIVTVAGTATRFNRDTDKETLKCLYYETSPCYSLLYQILDKAREIDQIIIVGGYLYDKLITFTEKYLKEFQNQIRLVYNPYYKEYGSGYSLIKGIEQLPDNVDEIIFVEGDLFFDTTSFSIVKTSSNDVITVNREFITSQKAVALYIDETNVVHYVYDTNHSLLSIPVPIKAIYNSGQIWKFISIDKLQSVIRALSQKQVRGTNLEIIQGYFGNMFINDINIIPINIWFNCNTVADYKNVYSHILK